jgi:hypothetical protein
MIATTTTSKIAEYFRDKDLTGIKPISPINFYRKEEFIGQLWDDYIIGDNFTEDNNLYYVPSWKYICLNPGIKAIRLLEANPDRIYWRKLSVNPAAIHILEANMDRIRPKELSLNPAAVHLFENYLEFNELNWSYIAINPNAIPFMEEHYERIDWKNLALNVNLKDYLDTVNNNNPPIMK